jgi:hypothetical protein
MERSGRVAIFVSIALVLIAWQIPYGRLVIYPLSLLGTYVHEMGHGLTALILGADFERLVMFPDGSGFAEWRGNVGRLAKGAIAAGGLVGPSILGGLIVASSREPRLARPLLFLSSIALGLTALFFAGSLFTWVFVLAWAALLGVGARLLATKGSLFLTQLVGAVLCLSIFQDVRYMFSEGGVVGGVAHRSDSAAIADALLLPYWFWGGVVLLVSVAALALGLGFALRPATDLDVGGELRRR